MSTAILRPCALLSAAEAMNLRDSFKRVLEKGGTGVVVDLTGVQELSAAGLAAVTNLLGQGRRTGIAVRVLMPEDGTGAARIIHQADLGRFLAPGGVWNTLPTDHSGSVKPGSHRSPRRPRWLRRRQEASGAPPSCTRQRWKSSGCNEAREQPIAEQPHFNDQDRRSQFDGR